MKWNKSYKTPANSNEHDDDGGNCMKESLIHTAQCYRPTNQPTSMCVRAPLSLSSLHLIFMVEKGMAKCQMAETSHKIKTILSDSGQKHENYQHQHQHPMCRYFNSTNDDDLSLSLPRSFPACLNVSVFWRNCLSLSSLDPILLSFIFCGGDIRTCMLTFAVWQTVSVCLHLGITSLLLLMMNPDWHSRTIAPMSNLHTTITRIIAVLFVAIHCSMPIIVVRPHPHLLACSVLACFWCRLPSLLPPSSSSSTSQPVLLLLMRHHRRCRGSRTFQMGYLIYTHCVFTYGYKIMIIERQQNTERN